MVQAQAAHRSVADDVTLHEEPQESARAAGLRYVTDRAPGIRREKRGDDFVYFASDGMQITDEQELARIKALAIPPAWIDVWVCPNTRGHLQATGKDQKGRKQYRYHPKWRAVRDETKYYRLLAFGEALPRIRERIEADLALPGMPREKVLAAIVRLLDETAIRIGNEEYARTNESYGLTTLRNDHVDVEGTTVRFQFRGKRGKVHEVEVEDRRVARIIRKLEDLPGQHLFEYKDDNGEICTVESADVNDYLREISGEDFTAKDFRTWEATVIVAHELRGVGPAETKKATKANEKEAIVRAAEHLGNTPTILKKSYVHPAVLEGYESGALLGANPVRELAKRPGLHPEEAEVLAFLHAAAGAASAPQTRAG
jgi:DNA topoisomerase I